MKRNLIIFSSKGGGPFKQHSLLKEELTKRGYSVEHWYGWKRWLKLHFIKKTNLIVMSNVPFLFWNKKNKLILNIHGNYNKEKNLFRNPLGYFYNTNLKLAQKIIVPSVYLKNVLKLNKAIVVPNFLTVLNIKENKVKRNYIGLISVTHFAFKEKSMGVLEIVKSLCLLKTKEKLVFDVFGDGRYLGWIMEKVRKISLPSNIIVNFKGRTNCVYNELLSSDVFIYWSGLDSTVPLVIMEAMIIGLPIVANDFPSFKKEVGRNNFTCSNKREFAKSLDLLIGNKKLRQEISEKNKKNAIKYLPENSVSKFIKEIYEE
jgi:glycosyltransferase involved in cell wall biosynthesis